MNIALHILAVLDLADGFLVPQDTLCANVRMRTPVTNTEIREALGKLDRRGDIIGLTSEDAPGGVKWKLSDAGKARLMEAGI